MDLKEFTKISVTDRWLGKTIERGKNALPSPPPQKKVWQLERLQRKRILRNSKQISAQFSKILGLLGGK